MTVEGVHAAWQPLEYSVVDAINANVYHGQNSTFFKHPRVASTVRVHEGNEFVDVVHVIDEVGRITISVGDRLSEPYGYGLSMGAPCFNLLGERIGHELAQPDRLGVTSDAYAGASPAAGNETLGPHPHRPRRA